MDQNQALNLLVQAVNLAQKRGAYSLEEASMVAAAAMVFTKPTEERTEELTDVGIHTVAENASNE
tara:strand:+ start:3264 stop:3458 length:195 start_codon:yes stop_codon:yes gene_type:complete